ncbi:hypothetical protein DFH06DRAFT_1128396 [Mycena polygramma]|nr:hypothetical protein DFH06DRAFT_1128396 [Mycena polygramma]
MDHIRCATQYLRTTETKDKSRPPDRTWGDRSVAHEGVKQWTQTRQRRLDAKSTAEAGHKADSGGGGRRPDAEAGRKVDSRKLQLAKAKGQVYNIQIPVANSVDVRSSIYSGAAMEILPPPLCAFANRCWHILSPLIFLPRGFRYKFRWIPHLDLSSSFEFDTWYPIHPPSAHLASATRFIPQFLTYLSSPPTRLPLQAHRLTPTTTVQMPHNMDPFPASLPEQTRKNMMAALCRLAARAPIEAAEAYLNLRPYKEHPGFVYTHLRPNWEVLDNAPNVPMGQLDWVDIKVGKAEDMEDRQLGYESTCVGEPISWAFCYETSRPKLIERLTHLTLWEMGAKRVPCLYIGRAAGLHRSHEGVKQWAAEAGRKVDSRGWTQSRQRRRIFSIRKEKKDVLGNGEAGSVRLHLSALLPMKSVHPLHFPTYKPTHFPTKGFDSVGLNLASVWVTCFEPTGFPLRVHSRTSYPIRPLVFRYKLWRPLAVLGLLFEPDPQQGIRNFPELIPLTLRRVLGLCVQALQPLLVEETRKKMLGALCRLASRAPIEAAEAYVNLRPYKERPGFVYTHRRPNWEVLDDAPNVPVAQLDWVDIKVGQAVDLEERQLDYELDCVDEPIGWVFCYETSRPKLIERLTHLTLWEMGAKRVPYPCRGCGVRHREHFSEVISGGVEVVGLIIEYWMRRIGEQPTRILLDE